MTPKETKQTVKNGKRSPLVSTQRYLSFSGVHDDVLVLKNGGIRGVLEVSSVNFSLKSAEEQSAILYGYQGFLNALDFPIQILLRSRRLDISGYISDLTGHLKNISNELLKNQMREYIDYIQKLVEHVDIMEKKFFVVIPVNPLRAQSKGIIAKFLEQINPNDQMQKILQRRREFKTLSVQLTERIGVVQTGLENCGLRTKRLNTQEIISLFYQAYNPEESRNQPLDNLGNLAVETI